MLPLAPRSRSQHCGLRILQLRSDRFADITLGAGMADDNAVLELLPEEGVVVRPAVSKSEAQMIDVAATLIQARMRSSIARKAVTRTRVVSGKKKETFTTLEQMDLFILPDVDLELAVSYSRDAARKGHAGRFVITGPVDSLARIRKMVGRSIRQPSWTYQDVECGTRALGLRRCSSAGTQALH